jgi:hypothetical protein
LLYHSSASSPFAPSPCFHPVSQQPLLTSMRAQPSPAGPSLSTLPILSGSARAIVHTGSSTAHTHAMSLQVCAYRSNPPPASLDRRPGPQPSTTPMPLPAPPCATFRPAQSPPRVQIHLCPPPDNVEGPSAPLLQPVPRLQPLVLPRCDEVQPRLLKTPWRPSLLSGGAAASPVQAGKEEQD